MPKVAVYEDDKFEFEEFEKRVSPRRRHSMNIRQAQEYLSHTESSAQCGLVVDLLAVGRRVADHDVARLRALMKPVIKGMEGFQVVAEPGCSIFYGYDSRRIFKNYYLHKNAPLAARQFKKNIEKGLSSIEAQNDMLFPRLGRIGIFGAKPDEAGMRFVGPIIEEDGGEAEAEYWKIAEAVLPPGVDPKNILNKFVGHISLIKTEDKDVAREMREVFSGPEVGISGIWASLHKAQLYSHPVTIFQP